MDWAELRESALKFMMQFDVLICPPCNGPAPRHGDVGSLDFTTAYFFNYVGWPAAVVRVGKSAEGLPVGVQVVGRPWREDNVLAVALQIEQKLGGWKRDFPETTLHGKLAKPA
jgi:amidase